MNIDKLKSVIQAANPEIMELRFGCEARQKEVFILLQNNKDLNGSFMVQNKETGAVFDSALLGGNWTILGRPIRLADVLMTIDKRLNYAVNQQGSFIDLENKEPEVEAVWNLKDDNLDNQSEECIKFLEELLC